MKREAHGRLRHYPCMKVSCHRWKKRMFCFPIRLRAWNRLSKCWMMQRKTRMWYPSKWHCIVSQTGARSLMRWLRQRKTEKKWWYLWNCGHGLTRQITLRCRTGSKMPAARFCMDWAITKYIRSFAWSHRKKGTVMRTSRRLEPEITTRKLQDCTRTCLWLPQIRQSVPMQQKCFLHYSREKRWMRFRNFWLHRNACRTKSLRWWRSRLQIKKPEKRLISGLRLIPWRIKSWLIRWLRLPRPV